MLANKTKPFGWEMVTNSEKRALALLQTTLPLYYVSSLRLKHLQDFKWTPLFFFFLLKQHNLLKDVQIVIAASWASHQHQIYHTLHAAWHSLFPPSLPLFLHPPFSSTVALSSVLEKASDWGGGRGGSGVFQESSIWISKGLAWRLCKFMALCLFLKHGGTGPGPNQRPVRTLRLIARDLL